MFNKKMLYSVLNAAMASLLGLFFLVSLASQASAAGTTAKEYFPAAVSMNRVAIMPFFNGRAAGTQDEFLSNTLDCPVATMCTLGDPLLEDPAAMLTEQVFRKLRQQLGSKLLEQQYVNDVFHELPQNPLQDSPRVLVGRLGEKLGVDHVIVGTVWRYREKELGLDRVIVPAAVSFALYLVKVENGRRLWRGEFIKTQQSLSENILKASDFFKQGGKWITADELARLGVREVLKSFPAVK